MYFWWGSAKVGENDHFRVIGHHGELMKNGNVKSIPSLNSLKPVRRAEAETRCLPPPPPPPHSPPNPVELTNPPEFIMDRAQTLGSSYYRGSLLFFMPSGLDMISQRPVAAALVPAQG